MSAPKSESASPHPSPFRLTPRAWWLIAAAVAVGVLLFLALWIDQRNDRDVAHPGGEGRQDAAGQVFAPLPAPPVADGDAVERMPADEDMPPAVSGRIEEPPSPQPAPEPMPEATPPPAVEMAPASVPVALETPPPRYPASALRRGESGEVMLRVDVDAEGRVADVNIVHGSGSRALDRAALSAVRDWRFRPGQRDGRPVPGAVNVPITFNSGR